MHIDFAPSSNGIYNNAGSSYVQDGQKILRRGNRGNAGGGRHHFLSRGQGEHHQQLRLQDTSRPAQVYEQV